MLSVILLNYIIVQGFVNTFQRKNAGIFCLGNPLSKAFCRVFTGHKKSLHTGGVPCMQNSFSLF